MKVWIIRKLSKMPPIIAGGQPTLFYEPVSAGEPWFTSEAQAIRARNGLMKMMNNTSLVLMSFETLQCEEKTSGGPAARPGESTTSVGSREGTPGDNPGKRLGAD